MNRSSFVTVDAPIFQFHGAGYLGIGSHSYIFDVSYVHNHTSITDFAHVRSMLFAVKIDNGFHALDKLRSMAVQRVNVGKMC